MKKGRFCDSIQLDQEMSLEEVVEKLATFHEVTKERIVEYFFLQEGETVRFNKTMDRARECIRMEIYGGGKFLSNNLLDPCTGNKQQRCG